MLDFTHNNKPCFQNKYMQSGFWLLVGFFFGFLHYLGFEHFNRLFRNVAGEVKWLQTRLLFAILSPNAFLGKRSNIAVSLDLTRRVRLHTARACTRITYCIYVMIYVYTCCKSALHSHVLPLANTVGNVRRKFLSLNGMFLHNQKWIKIYY